MLHRPERKTKLNMTSRVGFTLIELLVVISIIALLISILLPALGAARRNAMMMKCLSQQKQIVTAMYGYMGDHKDYMPPAYSRVNRPYNEIIALYLGDESINAKGRGWGGQTIVCPSDSIERTPWAGESDVLDPRRSYSINGSLLTAEIGSGAARARYAIRISEVPVPAKTVFTGEWHYVANRANSLDCVIIGENIALSPNREKYNYWPHPAYTTSGGNGLNNLSFLDGHCQSVKPDDSYANQYFSLNK